MVATVFCIGKTLEFRIKNSISKHSNMSINFSITGTMSGTVRRSLVFNSISIIALLLKKIFRLVVVVQI